jgi:hypothetical protein
MHWKGCGRKQSWLNLWYYHNILPEETEENHEEPQTGLTAFRSKFESGTSRIQSRKYYPLGLHELGECRKHMQIAYTVPSIPNIQM